MPDSRRPSPPLPSDLELAQAYDEVAPGFPLHAAALRAVAAFTAKRTVDRVCDAVVPLVAAAKAAADAEHLDDAVALVEELVTGPVNRP